MISIIKLFKLFLRESSDFGKQFFMYTLIAGFSQTSLLVIINNAAGQVAQGKLGVQSFFLFVTTLLLYVISQKYILSHFMRITEEVKEKIRVRLASKIRQADCYKLEKLNTSEIYATVVKETAYITHLSPRFMNGIQSILMIGFTLLYIAWLSRIAFGFVVGALVIQVLYIHHSDRKTMTMFKKSTDAEVDLLTGLTDVMQGFRQIKLNEKKGDSVLAGVAETAARDRSLKTGALEKYLTNYVTLLIFFYLLIGIFIFIIHNNGANLTPIVYKLITTMLFLIDPLWNLVELSSKLMQIGVSVENIYHLEDLLNRVNDGIKQEDEYLIQTDFHSIIFKNVNFIYTDHENEKTFRVGPINLKLHRGEVIFIVGSNGCGKSTFLKLLTTLYFPTSGQILLDNLVLTKENVQSFREMYSIILADFHLFDKLHGIEKVYPGRVAGLLRTFGLENKTAYRGKRFTNIALSTGQRKRLAMIIAYLEDKDIYVFDEWAADQDPQFKKYFYEEILADLKKRGKTVIVVSHDNNYFHVADRVLIMEAGRFVSDQIQRQEREAHRRPKITEVNWISGRLGKTKPGHPEPWKR